MSSRSLVASLLICVASAVLEGVCAGRDVKSVFATLRSPKYSAPLPVWYAIGLLYYATFGFVLYRALAHAGDEALQRATIGLAIAMMIANALWNLVFFRARNLFVAFLTGTAAPLFDVALLWCLLRLDTVAAWALAPYLVYRVYAVWWGYALWTNNRTSRRPF